jgi:predicted nucleotidyltransferase
VAPICRRHRVARLDVFGSAARQEHGAADLDFLVEFEDLPTDAYADAYFGLLSDLKALFERPVDLVMASALKNPFAGRRSSRRASCSMLPEARSTGSRRRSTTTWLVRCCVRAWSGSWRSPARA